MAIEDISFTNLRGETINRANLVQQMIDYYGLKLGVGETKVTDFNEGSEIRNLLESFAVDVYWLMEMENEILKQAFVDTATGTWLDKIGMHPFVNLPRDTGGASHGSVTFSIPSALTSDVVIPEATLLLGSNNLYYTTDLECVISAGDTSESVSCTCATVGSDGNCVSGVITTIDDSYYNNNSVSVTNANAFSDGFDYEDDEVYRSRLLNFIRRDDFGSLGYYKSLCESVAGVHDVVLVDATGYTKKVLVNGTSKPTSDALLLKVLTVLSDLSNTVIGHSFTVGKPTFDTIDLNVAVTVNDTMDANIIKNILKDLFDGGSSVEGFEFDGLNISQGLSEKELYGVFDVIDNIQSVTIKDSNNNTVTSISCTANHVLKAGTFTVTQTEV